MKLARTLLLALAAVVLAAPSASFADALEGAWNVVGWESGAAQSEEPAYEGQAVIKKHGDGYVFEGIIDGGEYFGVGLFDEKGATLSLAFQGPSGNDAGLTVLTLSGDTLTGRWLYLGDEEGRVGREVWTREKQ
ncbi:hypothetical protein dsat_1736 [Alkalidesulfovibrio alkalitolerans DSM 16529]|jgi:hypothetical protein|uniref:TIGR03067 domain-containing protein n=1 Tax=Alkalidesulfovibrio alkalitolerans DSM 16529 TaxID=1121439 RepID=S7UV30_9BACT|nr:hypothetical protein [Alkalidesulfovibrio alkalitolerans]EPR36208.1 hypothetical protein dsat_1736 [Alkalidesulfovibrio alkalitolerans DSM 16529]